MQTATFIPFNSDDTSADHTPQNIITAVLSLQSDILGIRPVDAIPEPLPLAQNHYHLLIYCPISIIQ